MPAPFSSPFVTIGGRRTCPCSSMVCCRHPTLRQFFPLLSPTAYFFPTASFLPPAGNFLPIAAESFHRRVSRFPATLWRENRDTSSKPPRFIRHRRRFGGFRQKPLVFGSPFLSRVSFNMGLSRGLTQQQTRCRSRSGEGACGSTAVEDGLPRVLRTLAMTPQEGRM